MTDPWCSTAALQQTCSVSRPPEGALADAASERARTGVEEPVGDAELQRYGALVDVLRLLRRHAIHEAEVQGHRTEERADRHTGSEGRHLREVRRAQRDGQAGRLHLPLAYAYRGRRLGPPARLADETAKPHHRLHRFRGHGGGTSGIRSSPPCAPASWASCGGRAAVLARGPEAVEVRGADMLFFTRRRRSRVRKQADLPALFEPTCDCT